MPSALENCRVLDFTQAIAGPYAAQLLADMGAECIRVEEPARGPAKRQGFSPAAAPGRPPVPSFSPFFMQHNRNKKSMHLDIKKPAGLAVLADLIRVTDVVIENLLPKTHAKIGIGYEWAKAINPRIIWASISAYGRTGPEADRGGFDFLAQARGGMMSVTGEAGQPPLKSGVSIGDYLGGLHLAIGILGAMQYRERSGAGQLVDVALLDSVAACVDGLTLWPEVLGVVPGRIGNFYPVRPPGYSMYACKDGYIATGASKGPLWERLAHVIGRPDMTPEPEPSDTEAWEAYVEEGVREVGAWAAKHTRAEAREILDAAGVPSDPVQDMAEVMDDPQLHARGMIQEFNAAWLGPVRSTVSPIHMSETPPTFGTSVPEAGEHTYHILKDVIGYSEDRIAEIVAAGVTETYE